MTIVLNYSHPLSDKAKLQLVAAYGEINEVLVTCQIDFDGDIERQLSALVELGHKALYDAGVGTGETFESYWETWPDLIVPPALSFAAAYVSREFMHSEHRAGMIVLKASPGAVRQFELATVI